MKRIITLLLAVMTASSSVIIRFIESLLITFTQNCLANRPHAGSVHYYNTNPPEVKEGKA